MSLLQTDFFRKALAADWVVAILKRTALPLDRFLLRISRGYLNTAMQSVALLTAVGAKSGLPRSLPILCMPVENGVVIVGSNWGGERDPAWVRNLRVNPLAQVTYRGYVGAVTARELQGQARTDMWQRLIDFNPQYIIYQEGTTRELPVVLLEKPAQA